MDNKRFYVYVFVNLMWNEPFYVGKGTGNRINDNNRNPHVAAILNNYPCKRIIVMDNLDNNVAIQCEKRLKELLIKQGRPIIDYERRNTIIGQLEGIEKAKKKGVYKGRRPVHIDDDIWNMNYKRFLEREINKGQLAKVLKISRPTLDKLLQEQKEKYNNKDYGNAKITV